MIRFTETLYAEMQSSIQELSMDVHSFVQRAERSFYIAESHLLKLREYILDYSFEDVEEEILFFKSIKPRFHKELLYWAEIVCIEACRPSGEDSSAKRYIKNRLKEIQGYIVRNHFIYEYYKLDRTHMDEILYLRNSSFPLLPVDCTGLEPAFSTPAGNILAGIMAMEEVALWLKSSQEQSRPETGSDNEHAGLVWTGSKAQLIELVYALESYGVFNNGKTNIKEVMSYLQYCFKVDKVANYYGYFQGMRIRKKDRTPFLNGLIEHVTRRMDESDEFPRFS